MCILIIKPSGKKLPPKQHLITAEKKNQDGIGIAVANGEDVFIKKDFKGAEECYNWLQEHTKGDDAIFIHLRIATSGLVDEGNRHPYPVTKDLELMRKTEQSCKVAAAHNGVFSDVEKHIKYNDSMLFIKEYISELTFKQMFTEGNIQKLINKAVGYSRFAVLNYTGDLVYFGNFTKVNGCLYSNESYKEILPVVKGYSNIYGNNRYQMYGKYSKYCDVCKQKIKSKWRKEDKMYICPTCWSDLNNDGHDHKIGDTKILCDACGSYLGVHYRGQYSQFLCEECHNNQIWFSKLLAEKK